MHLRALLLLLFIFTDAEQCPFGYHFSDAANKCYRVYKERLTFMEAQYKCTQGGGDLATIPNQAANDFVHSLLGTDYFYTIGAINFNVYYNGYEYFINSTKWIDGTPFNYSNFAPEVPGVVINFPSCAVQTQFTIFQLLKLTPALLDGLSMMRPSPVIACFANLTSVTSANENGFLIGLAGTGLSLNPNQQVWIGVRRLGSIWYNIDGSPYTYSNFGPYYPRPVDGDNNCAILFADRWNSNPGFVGYWQDYSCSSTQRAYICKKLATYI